MDTRRCGMYPGRRCWLAAVLLAALLLLLHAWLAPGVDADEIPAPEPPGPFADVPRYHSAYEAVIRADALTTIEAVAGSKRRRLGWKARLGEVQSEPSDHDYRSAPHEPLG